MASAHISVNGTGSRHNRLLREFVDDLVSLRARAAHLKEVLDQMALGGDWQALAAGLDIADGDDAQAIYNLLGSVKAELEAIFITQMVGRLG